MNCHERAVNGVPYVCLLLLALVLSAGCSPPKEIPQTRAPGGNFDRENYRKSPSTKLYPQSWALVIGINKYKERRNFPELSYAVNDARKFKAELEYLGFQHIDILEDEQATKQAISDHLERLTSVVDPKDRVLIFFAGHGKAKRYPTGKEEGFLIPYDAEINRLSLTAIKMKDDIESLADHLVANHILVVLDACYSGFATGIPRQAKAPSNEKITLEELHKIAGQRAVQIMTAGRTHESATEKEGHGIFTKWFIEGLSKADVNHDDVLTVDELHTFVSNEVSRETHRQQNPVLRTFAGEGQFLLKWPSPLPSARDPKMAALETQRSDLEKRSSPPSDSGDVHAERKAEEVRRFRDMFARAKRGDILAQTLVGEAYSDGIGVEKNDEEALRWIQKAAAQGEPYAQALLGTAYLEGIGGLSQDEATAKLWLDRAAKKGDPYAQALVGMMYMNGRGVEQSDTEAVKWYRQAAKQGNVLAQEFLGMMYMNGRGVEQSDAEAARWFREAAEQGNIPAQVEFGRMRVEGRGIPKDEAGGVDLLSQAASQGSAAAQNQLGLLHIAGRGVPQDDTLAVKWFREAAVQGFAAAKYNLGFMYAEGRGVEQSASEAERLYREAAAQGFVIAQRELGVIYASGRRVEQNDVEAVKWFRKAAEQGDVVAQAALGMMYGAGRGIEQNDAEAVKWLSAAAKQGYPDAQTYLGWHYANGRGVEQNDVEAIKWYRKAAEQGDSDAQANLGWHYANGRGVEQNDVEAIKWYRKAAERGNARAQEELRLLTHQGSLIMPRP